MGVEKRLFVYDAGDGPHTIDDRGIGRHRLRSEAWVRRPEVTLSDPLRGEGAREEAATERAIREEADSALLGEREHAVDDVLIRPQRQFALHARHRMHGIGGHDLLDARLGQSEVADLARADQLGHGAPCLLDRHLRIHAVQLVEIDRVDAEPAQRCIARSADMLGRAVAPIRGGVDGDEADLRRDDDAVAQARAHDVLADDLLVGERSVDIGGVE